MNRRLLGAAVLSLTALLAPMARTESNALSLVRVRVSTPEQAAQVASGFDETHNLVEGAVEVLLWPGDAARLRSLGFTWETVVADVARADATALREAGPAGPPVDTPGPERSEYRTLAEYNAEMKGLAARYPKTVRLITMPLRTLEGRSVQGVEIAADVHAVDGRPTFAVDGVHHAREWPAGEYSMFFAHLLVEKYVKGDPRVTRLLKAARVTIVPIVNPDGFQYSRSSPGEVPALGAVGLEAYWRKNRRGTSGQVGPNGHAVDAYGVDPNRNYGFLWGDDQGGSSSVQGDQTYRGTDPFSEPESENVKRLLLSRHVTAYISNHTYGRLVIRPWGDTDETAPDEAIMEPLGEAMADAMDGYRNIIGLELYLTTGTASDWAYGTLGSLGYTFEHGAGFHPTFDDNTAPQAELVIDAFMLAAEAAADPRHHGVLRGRVVDRKGRPVPGATLSLSKAFENPLWPNNPAGLDSEPHTLATSLVAGRDGSFTWHVNPSTRPKVAAEGGTEAYSLVVAAPGLQPRTLKVVVRRGQRVDLGTIRLG